MADPLPPVPAAFKPVQHYLKTALEHEKRDAVVAYYCRLYAMQKAMEIDRKSPECRSFLQALMNVLEQGKRQCKDLEAIQNEVVGQAHMENYAIKLFYYADTEDRAGRFGKNVVKSFYSAGMLMDVLTNFGELPEDVEKNRKYAKWKAAYIHNCLKNGETPQPGPLDEMGEIGAGFGDSEGGYSNPGAAGNNQQPMPGASSGYGQPPASYPFSQPPGPANSPSPSNAYPQGPSSQVSQPSPHHTPVPAPRNAAAGFDPRSAPVTATGVALRPEDYTKAMKFCKYASSALQYEDAKTAIDNLHKALALLTTGHE